MYNQHQQQEEENLQKKKVQILRHLNQSEDISLQTITALKIQDEQIGRIENVTAEIHQDLDLSKKIVKK